MSDRRHSYRYFFLVQPKQRSWWRRVRKAARWKLVEVVSGKYQGPTKKGDFVLACIAVVLILLTVAYIAWAWRTGN